MRTATACFLGVAALAAAMPAAADAGGYPARPVRVIVPGSAGVSADITARVITSRLAETWPHQPVVDNRPGAGGILGAKLAATATKDGYTLLVTNPGPGLQNVILRKRPAYALADFAPIVYVGYAPLIIAASPAFAAKNVADLVAAAKSRPGKVRWASAGTGSNPHTALQIVAHLTGIDVLHVPYKGGTAPITGLISGEVDVYYTTWASTEAHIRAGRLKVIAVGGPKRLGGLPSVATLDEQGVRDAGANYWYGIVTAAGSPADAIEAVNRDVNRVLARPDVRRRFGDLGIEVVGGTPAAFGKFLEREAARLSALVAVGAVQRLD